MTRESVIEGMARTMIKSAGGLMLKWVSPGRRGVPDNLVFWPGGIVHLVEFKATGVDIVKDSPQDQMRKKFHDLGCAVWLLDDMDLVKDYVAAYGRRRHGRA